MKVIEIQEQCRLICSTILGNSESVSEPFNTHNAIKGQTLSEEDFHCSLFHGTCCHIPFLLSWLWTHSKSVFRKLVIITLADWAYNLPPNHFPLSNTTFALIKLFLIFQKGHLLFSKANMLSFEKSLKDCKYYQMLQKTSLTTKQSQLQPTNAFASQ